MFNRILNNQSGKQMQQSNPLSPLRMTPSQRLSEVACIIAQSIIRLRSPDSNSPPLLDSDSDISLAMPAYRSVHGEPENNANIQEKK
jgi:hypothetical protein